MRYTYPRQLFRSFDSSPSRSHRRSVADNKEQVATAVSRCRDSTRAWCVLVCVRFLHVSGPAGVGCILFVVSSFAHALRFRNDMFSAPQAPVQSPWGQKTAPGTFGTQRGTPGGMPSTPMASSQNNWLQTQGPPGQGGMNNTLGTPGQFGSLQQPGQGFSTPQQPGATGLFGTPQNASPAPFGAAGATASPSQAATSGWGHGAQASPMNQAPVAYLPGYLNKMRAGERANSASLARPGTESTSPAAKVDPDTSLLASNDGTQSRQAPTLSPTNGFHSSFFSRGSVDFGDSTSTRSLLPGGQGVREGSIFGHGGLRGSMRGNEEADRSMSRPPRSPSVPNTSTMFSQADTTAFAPGSMDDDDAPPQEALCDVPQMQAQRVWDASSSVGMGPSPQPPHTATTPMPTQEMPANQRTVIVYGFPPSLRPMVLEQFSSIGGLVSADDVDMPAALTPAAAAQMPDLPKPLRLTYSDAVQAMHAMRQTGRPVAGMCMIGVRWENDAMHQQSLVRGLDAPLLSHSSMDTRTPSTAAKPAAVPTTPASFTKGAYTNAPAFGRPISKVDTPVAALAQSSAQTTSVHSPFRAVVHAGESLLRGSQSQTGSQAKTSAKNASGADTANTSGVLGRLADGLFGW